MFNFLFNLIHGNRLIYNACWEDPQIDRQLLKIDADSKVVMITSAGCNALDYLLDSPREIHAVDVNYRQNALLELKLALFARRNFADLFAMFGEGSCDNYQEIYQDIRNLLSPAAQRFWDQKITYFSGRGLRKSFYWRGAAGDFAWLMRRILLGNGERRRAIDEFLKSETLAGQKEYYSPLEEKIFSRPVSWLIRQPWCMAMIGVPKAQIRLLEQTHPRGLSGYVQDKLKQVMTELPFQNNYFWRVYLTGSYSPACCPNYLKKDNFDHDQKLYCQSQNSYLHVNGIFGKTPWNIHAFYPVGPPGLVGLAPAGDAGRRMGGNFCQQQCRRQNITAVGGIRFRFYP